MNFRSLSPVPTIFFTEKRFSGLKEETDETPAATAAAALEAGKAAAVTFDDLHSHGEVKQIVQQIEAGTERFQKCVEYLSDILSKIV